jgi:CheY-like chemotaxis protein
MVIEPEPLAILVVDDDAFVREAISYAISRIYPDAVVESAADFEGALAAVQRRRFDLLLVDLMLGSQSGLTIVQGCACRSLLRRYSY